MEANRESKNLGDLLRMEQERHHHHHNNAGHRLTLLSILSDKPAVSCLRTHSAVDHRTQQRPPTSRVQSSRTLLDILRDEDEDEEEEHSSAALLGNINGRTISLLKNIMRLHRNNNNHVDTTRGEVGPARTSALLEENDEHQQLVDEGERHHYCCVCMVRHKDAAFIPCGHTFCRLCSRELWVQRGNCPLCNNKILQILDIF